MIWRACMTTLSRVLPLALCCVATGCKSGDSQRPVVDPERPNPPKSNLSVQTQGPGFEGARYDNTPSGPPNPWIQMQPPDQSSAIGPTPLTIRVLDLHRPIPADLLARLAGGADLISWPDM